jgi:pimeloyl-ACP methyl ester carboxylesterase
MLTHTVEGGGGLNLHVRECGNPDAPAILFIHGWSQHHLCWSRQFNSPLADEFRLVAMDLRGHGQSEAPLDADAYTNGALWADDVRNVIDTLQLGAPLLVGWSYGGFVISDYLRRYGDSAVAGVNFVAAAVGTGKPWFGTHIGSEFLKYVPPACSEDQAVALKAVRDFLHICFVKPVPAEDRELAMGWTMLVHPKVRSNLMRRSEDFTPDLAKMTKPALITCGDADAIILPEMAKTIHSHVPNSDLSVYPGVGHAPFLEDTDRFNTELAAFARRCFAAA